MRWEGQRVEGLGRRGGCGNVSAVQRCAQRRPQRWTCLQVEEAQRRAAEAVAEQQGLPKPAAVPVRRKQVGAARYAGNCYALPVCCPQNISPLHNMFRPLSLPLACRASSLWTTELRKATLAAHVALLGAGNAPIHWHHALHV